MSTSHRRAWLVLVGCFLVATGFNTYLIAPASLFPLLVEGYAIDKPAAGLSISVVFLSWALLQIPGGFLMDRYDNRLLVYAGVVVFGIASVGGLFAPDYGWFLASRFVGGAAAVSLWATNANIVNQSFPDSHQALGTSLFVTSAPVGAAIAQFAGPLIANAYGWKAVFVVYPLFTLVGLPVFALVLREPIRDDTPLSFPRFVEALRNPTILLVSISSFCAYSLFVFFNSWMPTYATEVLSIDLAGAGAATALVALVGILARPGGGWLSDRIGGRRRPVLVAAFVVVIPVTVGITYTSSFLTFGGMMVLAGVGSQLGTGVFYVYVNELADPETAGTALAVLTTLSITGSLTAPVLAGWLIETYSWSVGLGYGVLLALVGIAAVLPISEP